MGVAIRKASSDDLGVIHEIRRNAILGIEPDDLGGIARQAWADRRSPEFFAERVAAGEVVLALSGSGALGWGSSSGDYITGVYIRSSSGRTGVGRAIMSRLEADIVKRGHECATLDASPNAVGFYVRLGYTPVGPPADDGAVPMRKALRVPDRRAGAASHGAADRRAACLDGD
jgi:putative acetyltransferase